MFIYTHMQLKFMHISRKINIVSSIVSIIIVVSIAYRCKRYHTDHGVDKEFSKEKLDTYLYLFPLRVWNEEHQKYTKMAEEL